MKTELIPYMISFAGSMSHCSLKSVCTSTLIQFTENLTIGRLIGPIQIKIEPKMCRKLLKMQCTYENEGEDLLMLDEHCIPKRPLIAVE
jgi:hypothetical protein